MAVQGPLVRLPNPSLRPHRCVRKGVPLQRPRGRGFRRLRQARGLALGTGLNSPVRTSGGRSRPPPRFPDPSLRAHRFGRASNARKRTIASGCADGATRRNLQLQISSFLVLNRDFFTKKRKKLNGVQSAQTMRTSGTLYISKTERATTRIRDPGRTKLSGRSKHGRPEGGPHLLSQECATG